LENLKQLYARRVREYSDAVACLGRCFKLGPEIFELWDSIEHQRALCNEAHEDLGRRIEEQRAVNRVPRTRAAGGIT
jgi:hypothetical protein